MTAETGHNSSDARLRSLADRIIRLTEEKRERAEDIAEVYKEAKSAGYEVKALRIVVKHEMEDDAKRAERERIQAEADMMLAAIGPLGASAVERRR